MLLQIIILGYIIPTAVCYYLLLIDFRVLEEISEMFDLEFTFEKDSLLKMSFTPLLNISIAIATTYIFLTIEK